MNSIEIQKIPGFYATDFFDVKSDSVDETYRIFVAMPDPSEVNRQYRTVYVLDGNATFGAVADTQRSLALNGESEPAVVVGVGYAIDQGIGGTIGKRFRDYSPTSGGHLETINKDLVDPEGLYEIGGGSSFLSFLTEELRPLVEQYYPVEKSKSGIFGMSIGGLFATWTMLTRPYLFDRYVICSPSLWWDKEAAWMWEAQAAEGRSKLNGKAMFSVGGLEAVEKTREQVLGMQSASEGNNPSINQIVEICERDGWPKMLELVPTFVDRLQQRCHSNFEVRCLTLEDETHTSAPFSTIACGLRYIG